MRVLATIVLSSAALLLPQFAAADPAQPQSAAAAPAAPASTPAAAANSPMAPAPTVGPQVAQSTAPAAEAAVNLDEVVCKTSPPQIGSRLGGGRECHTVRQWKERQQNSQDTLQKAQSLGTQQPLKTFGGGH